MGMEIVCGQTRLLSEKNRLKRDLCVTQFDNPNSYPMLPMWAGSANRPAAGAVPLEQNN
jgi:hypothetical protein